MEVPLVREVREVKEDRHLLVVLLVAALSRVERGKEDLPAAVELREGPASRTPREVLLVDLEVKVKVEKERAAPPRKVVLEAQILVDLEVDRHQEKENRRIRATRSHLVVPRNRKRRVDPRVRENPATHQERVNLARLRDPRMVHPR